MRAAVFGICVNLCLFMVKLYVGISTNSISIYVDSLNNALDSVVCIIALVGFWLSVRTSPKYPFGLGRAEDLTGFITAVVIVGTGFWLRLLCPWSEPCTRRRYGFQFAMR